MKTRFALTFALLLPALPALADDQANAAQTALLAASCANCHGTDGKLAGVIPAIANRPATALENQLMEFLYSCGEEALRVRGSERHLEDRTKRSTLKSGNFVVLWNRW